MRKIVIHSQDHLYLIDHDDILFCRSNNNYTEFQLLHKKILVTKSLAKFSKELPDTFIRVSQSYLINKNHIKSIDKKKKCIEMHNESKVQFTTTIKQLLHLIGV